MMLFEMFKSRTILMVLTLLAITIAVNVWSARNPSNPVAQSNDERLAVYLEQYRTAQLDYRKSHPTFASDLRALETSGLAPQDREVRLEVRKADANSFCVIAEHAAGAAWFRASNLGVLRLGSRAQPTPTACD